MITDQNTDRSLPEKGTLYCPNCDHESPIGGDWTVRMRNDCADYDCPACDTTIASRPGEGLPTDGSEERACECLAV